MNVLFVDQFSGLGGGQQCLRDLVPAMVDRGWNVHVALPPGGPLCAELTNAGAWAHPLSLARYTNGRKTAADFLRMARDIPRLASELAQLIRVHRIDVVYANGPRVLPAAALVSNKLVFHVHSLLNAAYSKWLAGLSLWTRNATAIAACRFVAHPLEPFLEGSRLELVYSGVPDYWHPPLATRPAGMWRIGIVGRISPEKGQADFLRAARIVHRHQPRCEFVVCGAPLYTSGSVPPITELTHGLPVRFTGWKSDISPILRGLDMVVVPSSAIDAAPRVVLEAFSAGLPVVAYPSGGIPELIRHGENGLLTSAPTPDSLAQTILGVMGGGPIVEQLGRAARETYLSRFTVGRFRHEVMAILERL